MIDILSVENMRKSDARTIAEGIPGVELMMRAARGIFESVAWSAPVGIVCGSGNNAGDGYALACLLDGAGINCTLILASDRFSDDGRYYYEKCLERNIGVIRWTPDTDLTSYATIVDCLLGTGFKGHLRDDISQIIDSINRSGAYTVSADINSGLNGDTGMAEKCVLSDLTVSIGSYKPGHFLNMAKDVMKSVVNVDIGIHPVDPAYKLIESSDVASLIPARPNMSNKGTWGYTALIGGSVRYSGAIRLAAIANAAMRSGAGVVKVALPGSLVHDVIPHILESTLFPLSDLNGECVCDESELTELTANVKTAAFGMGIGVSDETYAMLKYLIGSYGGRLIVDADGLTLLARMEPEEIRSSAARLILTPHLGEFSRLTHLTRDEILDDYVEQAVGYARKTGAILLLKGPSTLITDGEMVYITNTGCPGMATAGSGDVLSGILSAVCSYISDPLAATAAGAYINGLAGEIAQSDIGPVSMTAHDTAERIAKAVALL